MTRISFAIRKAVVANALGLCAVLALADAALAQSHEQILEGCRQSVGRPIVQACMNYQKGPPSEASSSWPRRAAVRWSPASRAWSSRSSRRFHSRSGMSQGWAPKRAAASR